MGYALGVSDFLSKPVDRNLLISCLNKYRAAEERGSLLVVEDDEDTRNVLCRMLKQEGWWPAEAANGRIALEMIEKTVPQLILLDLMMPEMDGFEFVAEMRKREEWRSIPIVVVTAKELTAEDRYQLNGAVQKILVKGASSQDQLLEDVRLLAVGARTRQTARVRVAEKRA